MDRLIIPTDSSFKNAFDAIVLLLVGYSCLTSLYAVAFSPVTGGLKQFDYAVDIIFGVDLVISFFKAYEDEETN